MPCVPLAVAFNFGIWVDAVYDKKLITNAHAGCVFMQHSIGNWIGNAHPRTL